MVSSSGGSRPDPLAAFAPGLFVLLWSTGFIGAKYGLPYAEPFTFLAIRFFLVAGLMAAVAFAARAPWPRRSEAAHIAIGGLLVHGIYLGGVFGAIHHGLPAGVTALIAGLQPLLTAIAAGPFLGETIRPRQWLGFILGLVGVALVVSNKLGGGLDLTGLPFALVAVLGITAGTLYQKRFCSGMDLRSGAVIQYAAALTLVTVVAVGWEAMEVRWTGEFFFALGWLSLVLSVGAITLLYRLIRAGSAAKIASLFYLVPPATTAIAFLVFGETLSVTALLGMAVAVVGVALATRG